MDPAALDTVPEIQSHEADNLELRHQHNAKSRINQLPVEILASIFSLSQTPCDLYEHKTHYIRQFISFSHVNSHWRAVALSSPSLWSTLYFLSQRWTDEMLRRSKGVPLSILLSSRSDHPSSLIDRVLDCSERIQNLSLGPHDVYMNVHKLCRPMPLLEKLTLRMDSSRRSTRPVEIPSSFFGKSSLLNEVTLYNCEFDWKSAAPSFHRVRNLRIIFPLHPNLPSWSWSNVLAVLSEMLELQLLELSCALRPIEPSEPVEFNRLIYTLPNLLFIRIEDELSAVAMMLGHMLAPRLKTASLECLPSPAIETQMLGYALTVTSFVDVHLGNPTCFVDSCSLPSRSASPYALSLNLLCNETHLSLENSDYSINEAFRLSFHIGTLPGPEGFISAIVSRLKQFTIDAAYLSGHLLNSLSFWVEVLEPHPLKLICIRNTELTTFVKVLGTVTPPPQGRPFDLQSKYPSEETREPLYWPTLTEIEITNVDFCENSLYVCKRICSCNLAMDLFSALKARAATGVGLEYLRLSNAENLKRRDAKLFNEVVDVVSCTLLDDAASSSESGSEGSDDPGIGDSDVE
jgi:hypothetical protein